MHTFGICENNRNEATCSVCGSLSGSFGLPVKILYYFMPYAEKACQPYDHVAGTAQAICHISIYQV